MSTSASGELPLRDIPGSYGPPFFGPIKDRYDYFYCQGKEKFFSSRVDKYNSTVFRTNMPPGPFISSDSKVIAVLDAASFPILFDTDRVEKKDVFVGTYMPSLDFTGGFRILSYLDPSEHQHKALKSFLLALLQSMHKNFIPNFRSYLTELFNNLDKDLSEKNEADFNTHSNSISFAFVFNMYTDRNPTDSPIGTSGPDLAKNWIVPQLAPIGTSGVKFLPSFIDDIVHTVPLPFCLVKSGYEKLFHAFYDLAATVLDQAEKVGLRRGEVCHNLVFISAFNSFGGMMVLFPTLIKWVSYGGEELHQRLATEIRAAVKANGTVTYLALENMPLTKSVVYETLRIEPPVPYQYGKAKEDIVISSHDASYQIKKGEMIFGYQPFATKDARVFKNPDQFVPERFMGEAGEKLKQYVYWSNGRETENPTPDNKQCPGKDLVVLWCRLLLVEFFLRYDTFTSESGENSGFGPPVKITSLRKASN